MAMKNVTFRLEEAELKEIDAYCEANGVIRSDFVRKTLLEKIKEPPVLKLSKLDLEEHIKKNFNVNGEKILDFNFDNRCFYASKGVNTKAYFYELQNNNKTIVLKDKYGIIVKVINL